jgi:TRAP-type transport system periplasmic protein
MPAALYRHLTAVLVALVLAAPAWSQGKIDMAIFHPEKNFWTPTLMWWIGEVDKATQGRVKITPHFAGALVSVNETMKAVRDGSVPAGVTSAAAVTGQIPAFAYLEAIGGMPADYNDFAQATNALRPLIEAEYRKQGVEYLWSQGSGGLIVVCRDRHLKSPADWKNRKVRTAGRWQAEQLRAMGVSPVATDPAEQYIALQNRTIDCALSVNVLALALKLHEVAPRITQLRMPVNLSSYIMNKSLYERISPEDRASMRKLAIEAEKRSADHLSKVERDAIAQMKSQKAEIYSLTDQELKDLRSGIAPSFAKMDAEGGETGKQIGGILKKYW